VVPAARLPVHWWIIMRLLSPLVGNIPQIVSSVTKLERSRTIIIFGLDVAPPHGNGWNWASQATVVWYLSDFVRGKWNLIFNKRVCLRSSFAIAYMIQAGTGSEFSYCLLICHLLLELTFKPLCSKNKMAIQAFSEIGKTFWIAFSSLYSWIDIGLG